MDNKKFKQLILDVYEKWEKLYRFEFGGLLIGYQKIHNFSASIYGEYLQGSFRDIKNINESIDEAKPSLLVLKSRFTNQEIGIYKDDITDYVIDDNLLIIRNEDKEIMFQM